MIKIIRAIKEKIKKDKVVDEVNVEDKLLRDDLMDTLTRVQPEGYDLEYLRSLIGLIKAEECFKIHGISDDGMDVYGVVYFIQALDLILIMEDTREIRWRLSKFLFRAITDNNSEEDYFDLDDYEDGLILEPEEPLNIIYYLPSVYPGHIRFTIEREDYFIDIIKYFYNKDLSLKDNVKYILESYFKLLVDT